MRGGDRAGLPGPARHRLAGQVGATQFATFREAVPNSGQHTRASWRRSPMSYDVIRFVVGVEWVCRLRDVTASERVWILAVML
jgi:hypothetical protein